MLEQLAYPSFEDALGDFSALLVAGQERSQGGGAAPTTAAVGSNVQIQAAGGGQRSTEGFVDELFHSGSELSSGHVDERSFD